MGLISSERKRAKIGERSSLSALSWLFKLGYSTNYRGAQMITALILFGVAAAGGLLLVFLRVTNKPLPTALALLHGALAASGLVALAMSVFGAGGPNGARLALGLFVLAALGGFVLFSFHLRKKQLPMGIVMVHALVAIAAFLILLGAILKAG
jgi:hypothetical protein